MHEISEETELPQDREPYPMPRFPVWHPEMNVYRRRAYCIAATSVVTLVAAGIAALLAATQ